MDPSAVVDATPLVVEALRIGGAVLLAVLTVGAGMAIRWLKARIGVDLQLSESEVRDYLESAIRRGMGYARNKIGKVEVNTGNNMIIKTAAEYVVDSVPDALRKFEITPDRVETMIRARLGEDQMWEDQKTVKNES